MSILSNVTSAAVGGIWKVAAIGLLAGMVTSSAYLGYQWHSAASDRDTAVVERSKAEGQRDTALSDNGALRVSITNQNRSIEELQAKSDIASAKYDTAMDLFGPIKGRLDAISKALAAQAPSKTCEQALSKQRQAIDSLRGVLK